MTAGIQAGAGTICAGGYLYIVNVQAGTLSTFGFLRASFGSVTPSTIKGLTIEQISSQVDGGGLGVDFSIQIATVVAQTFFKEIIVQETGGGTRRYSSASASFSTGVTTTWSWGNGTNAVWTAGSGNRNLLFSL